MRDRPFLNISMLFLSSDVTSSQYLLKATIMQSSLTFVSSVHQNRDLSSIWHPPADKIRINLSVRPKWTGLIIPDLVIVMYRNVEIFLTSNIDIFVQWHLFLLHSVWWIKSSPLWRQQFFPTPLAAVIVRLIRNEMLDGLMIDSNQQSALTSIWNVCNTSAHTLTAADADCSIARK